MSSKTKPQKAEAQERKVQLPVFTVEECGSCQLKTKRPFQPGDYVFKKTGECSRCKMPTMITAIYVETPKPKGEGRP